MCPLRNAATAVKTRPLVNMNTMARDPNASASSPASANSEREPWRARWRSVEERHGVAIRATLTQPLGTMNLMATAMLGQGLYDAAEVGWLLGQSADWVVRWSTDSAAGSAIVTPTFGRMFSFADLVSVRVGLTVKQRGIADRHLRQGVALLRELTGRANPLARKEVIETLATSGNSFLSCAGTGYYEDIGRGGQGVFQDVVKIDLKRISFDATGGPERWVPSEGIVIDPAIQAGAPCIEGTRVSTSTVASLLKKEHPEDVALDLNVTVEAVRLAKQFEQHLAGGHGLAA